MICSTIVHLLLWSNPWDPYTFIDTHAHARARHRAHTHTGGYVSAAGQGSYLNVVGMQPHARINNIPDDGYWFGTSSMESFVSFTVLGPGMPNGSGLFCLLEPSSRHRAGCLFGLVHLQDVSMDLGLGPPSGVYAQNECRCTRFFVMVC